MDKTIETVREENKGRLTRTLLWIGLILAVVFSPLICCVFSGVFTSMVM
jgi:hypothetical protein